MNEDQIHDRALNRHLDEKYQEPTAAEEAQRIRENEKFANRTTDAIMDYFTVMQDEPWQDTLFGVIDNFQLTSDECGAMVKAWIDRK